MPTDVASVSPDAGIRVPVAEGAPRGRERWNDHLAASVSPDLGAFDPELHQVVVDVAVDLAYARGHADGYRAGWDAGNHVGFAVRDRVEADRQRRLDDARTGRRWTAAERRDARLVDSLRQTGIMRTRTAA